MAAAAAGTPAALAALVALLLAARCGGTGAEEAAVRPPLRVQGRHVVDAEGQRVFLACVNWYGAHLEQMAANGLNRRPLADIASTVASLGFNCVRLPFSLDMVFGNYSRVPKPNVSLAANPELQRASPLEVFDATVSALTSAGVMVVLNNHVSSSGWCCSLTDGEGLWYTRTYAEDSWLRGIRLVAERYRDDPLVVGFDLRNEIRPSSLGTPTWGGGEDATDWSAAAVKGAEAVLDGNGDLLIIISGLHFSIFLCDVPRRPVHELVPALRGRTLYTTHEYYWVNFHLVGRAFLGGYLATLVAWWAGLWLLAALGWRIGSARCLAGDGSACRESLRRRADGCCRGCVAPCGCRPGRVQRSCELLSAVATTAAALVVLGATELFMDKCGLWHLVLSMFFLFVAFLCCLVSLVLWMRLAPVCVQRSQERFEASLPRVPFWQELAVPSPGARARLSESTEGCHPAAGRGEEQGSPPVPVAGGRLRYLARSKRCLAFIVSGLLLFSLGLTGLLYGRYEAFAGELDRRWGFLVRGAPLGSDEAAAEAPVWLGEFGTSTQDLWWQHMLRYLGERELAGWAYWSLNGEKSNGESESFGLLMEDSATVRHPWKLEALQRLLHAEGTRRARPRPRPPAEGALLA